MIDYEKLKLAHELLQKIKAQNIFFDICLISRYQMHADFFHHSLNILKQLSDEQHIIQFDNLDELIAKLQELTRGNHELTQHKPTYESGLEGWTFNSYDNQPFSIIAKGGGVGGRNIATQFSEEDLKIISAQPKPKYKDAWYLKGNLPVCTKVHNQYYYSTCDETATEAIGKTMYSSREVLIQAQIDYWTSLKKDDLSTRSDDMSIASTFEIPLDVPCTHESDGNGEYKYRGFSNSEVLTILGYKCTKCGEFYR